jgi:hypothetical protein
MTLNQDSKSGLYYQDSIIRTLLSVSAVMTLLHESDEHVFRCQSRSAWRVSFLRSLDEEMKKRLTTADIRREILTVLTEWFEQRENMLHSVSRHAKNQTEATVPQNQDLDIVDIQEMPAHNKYFRNDHDRQRR